MKKLLNALLVLGASAGLVAGCSESPTDRVGEREYERTPSASPPSTSPPPTVTPPPPSSPSDATRPSSTPSTPPSEGQK
jgi:hypothetical protein